MEVIRKKDITERLQKLIDARKDKNCSRQTIVERTAFEYCMAIVNSVQSYQIDQDL